MLADLSHGRLINPAPPLYQSFETFHENMYPTYCSEYAPAQGFVLALGQKLGSPWIGVLLSVSLMVGAFYWALRVWMPLRWAFLAAALVALKLGLTSYWMLFLGWSGPGTRRCARSRRPRTNPEESVGRRCARARTRNRCSFQ